MIEHLKIRDKIMEGKREQALEDAVNLLKLQIATPEQVTQVTGLPLEKVQELAKEIGEQIS